MVIVTTCMAPPLLKRLLSARPSERTEEQDVGIEDLVVDA
jgi:hypothetical protein